VTKRRAAREDASKTERHAAKTRLGAAETRQDDGAAKIPQDDGATKIRRGDDAAGTRRDDGAGETRRGESERVRGAGEARRRAIKVRQDAIQTRLIKPALLRRWPLPWPDAGGDKEERGRVLVVAGSPEMPGAAVLAATAALRAGAGKLQIATAASVARAVAVSVPEARVFALPEAGGGALEAAGVESIADYLREARAVLVGPGMCGGAAIARLVAALVPLLAGAALVLDADALNALEGEPGLLKDLRGRAILTPHATEMSEITGRDEESIRRDPARAARDAADRFGAVVALKGRETFVAAPGAAEVYVNRAGNVGLATSGSGDALAGFVAGLCARGAAPQQATAWGVFLHAKAGERLARRHGTLGYLARELLDELPAAMARLEAK
jgi:ADP-dependent NAD(P)H-hydrate dehydratase